MIQDVGLVTLKLPINGTQGQQSGSWIDTQGYDLEHGAKAVLLSGAGSVVGTCGGYIQVSDSSTGANAATLLTFPTKPTTGGNAEANFSTMKRYLHFVGTVQSTKSMVLGAVVIAHARYRP
jgi:hypothetical protein